MKHFLHRSILPVVAFAVVAAAHFIWQGVFPERDPVQVQWAAVTGQSEFDWARQYIETGGFWFGYSYALSLAFAAVALRRYRERQFCRSRNFAIGGVTLSGVLAVVGCYLLGCCGSPMLIVYVNLFGASFLSLAKPLVAVLTTIMVAMGWWWMNRADSSRTELGTVAAVGCHCERMAGSNTPQ